MNINNKISVLFIAVILITGCAGSIKGRLTPIPDSESPEARVYQARCGVCHSLPHPKRLTFEQWENMLSVMEKRIAEKNMKPLTPEEKEKILAYLKRYGR